MDRKAVELLRYISEMIEPSPSLKKEVQNLKQAIKEEFNYTLKYIVGCEHYGKKTDNEWFQFYDEDGVIRLQIFTDDKIEEEHLIYKIGMYGNAYLIKGGYITLYEKEIKSMEELEKRFS